MEDVRDFDPSWSDFQLDADICSHVSEIPQNECEALLEIYDHSGSRPSSWLLTSTVCSSWSGVNCEDGHVTELCLSDNGLRSLPGVIGNLKNLRSLSLSDNKLSSLPAEIGNLTNLRSLSLSRNELSSLPAEIGNLTNLRSLSLYGNELRSLPAEIGDLWELTDLNLGSNQLNSLPAEIGKPTYLESIDLSGNRLSSLPAEIDDLLYMWRLELAYNQLDIPEGDFRTLITKYDSDWADTQTVVPTDVQATVLGKDGIELVWTPIEFKEHDGYYEISVEDSTSFTVHGTTLGKGARRYVVDGLSGGVTYDIRIRTYTPAHEGEEYTSWDVQPNELWSDYSPVVSVTMPDQVSNMIYLPIVSR